MKKNLNYYADNDSHTLAYLSIDGKHARNAGMATQLGELFDHSCDAINSMMQSVIVTGAIQLLTNSSSMVINIHSNHNIVDSSLSLSFDSVMNNSVMISYWGALIVLMCV